MHKALKKLSLPMNPTLYSPSTGGGGGGGGGASTLYSANPALNTNDANAGFSFRISVPISGNSGTQVRVTFRPGTTGPLTILHASIGKVDSSFVPGWATTAAPLELKFSTASGFSSATTDQVSDWLDLAGLSFTTGDKALVIYDIPAGGPANQRYAPASTGVNTYYKDALESWNVINPASMNTLPDYNFCIVALETQ